MPGRGIVAGYSGRFWGLVAGLGVLTGAAAAALMALLRLVERIAFGSGHNTFLTDVSAASDLRRVVVLVLAGGIVAGAVRLRRHGPVTGAAEVSEALWLRGGRVRLLASLERGVLSIVTSAWVSRLAAKRRPNWPGPRWASRLSDWADLPLWQRRLLVAAGAGAGFGAVYNVPLGGALFALEVLLGTLTLPLVVPALAVSVIATAVAWITLGTAHTYVMPSYGVHGPAGLGSPAGSAARAAGRRLGPSHRPRRCRAAARTPESVRSSRWSSRRWRELTTMAFSSASRVMMSEGLRSSHTVDGAAARLIGDLAALAIGRRDGRAARQRHAERFGQRIHGGGRAHGVAMADRGRR